MDGVLCNLLSPWLDLYNADYNDNLKPEQINLWNWHSLTKENCQEKVYDYLDSSELFENLPLIEGSQEVVYELLQNYEIFICTAAHNILNVPAKYRWLQKNFPFIDEDNYVFTKNKSIVNSLWLIDDKPKNFNNYQGTPLLFTACHNKDERRFERVNNWNEVGRYFDWVDGLNIIGD